MVESIARRRARITKKHGSFIHRELCLSAWKNITPLRQPSACKWMENGHAPPPLSSLELLSGSAESMAWTMSGVRCGSVA